MEGFIQRRSPGTAGFIQRSPGKVGFIHRRSPGTAWFIQRRSSSIVGFIQRKSPGTAGFIQRRSPGFIKKRSTGIVGFIQRRSQDTCSICTVEGCFQLEGKLRNEPSYPSVGRLVGLTVCLSVSHNLMFHYPRSYRSTFFLPDICLSIDSYIFIFFYSSIYDLSEFVSKNISQKKLI